MEEKIKNTLRFLNDAELLKSVTRHSWTSSGRQESVAEHCWRMAIIALVLEKEFPGINIQRVVEICLVHDFGETYDGDTPAFEQQDLKKKLEKEEKDIRKLAAPLQKEIRDKIISLWKEYNECKTPESKLAKALDKLELLIQHNQADPSLWLIPEKKEFNLHYGRKFTDFHPFTKKFREIVDRVTMEKISKNEAQTNLL